MYQPASGAFIRGRLFNTVTCSRAHASGSDTSHMRQRVARAVALSCEPASDSALEGERCRGAPSSLTEWVPPPPCSDGCNGFKLLNLLNLAVPVVEHKRSFVK